MMTMKDVDALNRAHEAALRKMRDAAVAVAEQVCEAKLTPEAVREYRVARLGVESTRRDLEYCITLEVQQIL